MNLERLVMTFEHWKKVLIGIMKDRICTKEQIEQSLVSYPHLWEAAHKNFSGMNPLIHATRTIKTT